MSILIFLLVLFVLILVHELGHFIVAKRVGMRVDEFGIGFPPKLFGIKKGETEYTFNLFPIGGFVRIYGEDAVGVTENSHKRAFVGKSKWAQFAVLIAGVTANVLFAWVLFTGALMIGVQTPVAEDEATTRAELRVLDVIAGSPADGAGIVRGTEITGVGFTENTIIDVEKPSTFAEIVSDAPGDVFVRYESGDEIVTSRITPVEGLIAEEADRAVVGVALGLVEIVPQPFHIAVWEAGVMTVSGLSSITVGIATLLADALTLDADLSQVAGPVGIVGLVGEASSFGITALIMFTAFISLNLAVINLFPFPALDGGRLLFVVIEAIKGSPIKPAVVSGLNTIGFSLLILLMIAITYNDILRFF